MFDLICPDSVPGFLNFFDFSIAPPLLFYAYIPVVILTLILGFFIFLYSKDRLVAGLILSIALLFSLHTFLQIIQWITVYVSIVHLSWDILAIVEIFIYISFIYFVYVFINKIDLGIKNKILLFLVAFPTMGILFFRQESFDLVNCESTFGTLWYYIYIVEIISILLIIFLFYRRTHNENKGDKIINKQNLLILFGSVLFLGIFSATNIFGDLTSVYEINLIGPVGMILFLTFLTFIIVKFKAFDVKLLGAQALVWALIILVGSEFFFVENTINKVLVGITLVLSAIVGLVIIRSVKKEVVHMEEISQLALRLDTSNENLEKFNEKLEVANDKLKELDAMKSEFVSLATHQIRGPLAAIKGYISMMVEGDYGKVPKTFNEPLDTIFKSTDSLSHMVTDFLDVSRIDLGQMKYEFTQFDFRDLVREVVKELRFNIEAKGLEFRERITGEPCLIKADRTKLKQVLNNLVDNSSKYTKQGWLEVSVEVKGRKILFAVKDSGVGISKITLSQLFQRFSRAKNANDTNILGTGLGLYIAKKMVEANQGKVWAESEGEGKGAQFYVELNLVE